VWVKSKDDGYNGGKLASWLATAGRGALKRTPVPSKLAERRAHGGETWPTEWSLGHEVKVGPELRRAAAESALAAGAGPVGWHVRKRFVVRGHFRNQAHGEGRALRTKRWIEPYWKGPDGAEAWAHLYVDGVTSKAP
jgi:hypothetical protein